MALDENFDIGGMLHRLPRYLLAIDLE